MNDSAGVRPVRTAGEVPRTGRCDAVGVTATGGAQWAACRSHRMRQWSSSRSRRARHADRVSLDAQHLDPRQVSPHEPVGGRSSPDTRVVASRCGSGGIHTCMPTRFGGQPHVERHQRKPTHSGRRNSGRTGPQHRPRDWRSHFRWSDGSGVDSVAVHAGSAHATDLFRPCLLVLLWAVSAGRPPWPVSAWPGWLACLGSRTSSSGWAFASFGYIVGFVAAAWLVGWLAERGADRRVVPTIGMMALGNVVIYVFGVAGLMVLVRTDVVWHRAGSGSAAIPDRRRDQDSAGRCAIARHLEADQLPP